MDEEIQKLEKKIQEKKDWLQTKANHIAQIKICIDKLEEISILSSSHYGDTKDTLDEQRTFILEAENEAIKTFREWVLLEKKLARIKEKTETRNKIQEELDELLDYDDEDDLSGSTKERILYLEELLEKKDF